MPKSQSLRVTAVRDLFYVTDVTQASAKMRVVASRKSCKSLIYYYACVTSAM